MEVWAHSLVKNEARWLWYSVSSVINHVDKLLLWDTGSIDGSVEIEKELVKKYPDKIVLKNREQKTAEDFTRVRQEMLEETKADWLLILDGDEVWWEKSIKKLIETIVEKGDRLETIVSPLYNVVGDIYHYQDESAGQYRIDGRQGHLNIRAMNLNIPGLHVEKPHGSQGYYDGEGTLVQEREKDKRIFLEERYMHFTNVTRSSSRANDFLVPKRKFKLKYEIGKSFPKDFYYPEVFFRSRPKIVESIWKVSDFSFKSRASLETPLRKMKRKLWKSGVGY